MRDPKHPRQFTEEFRRQIVALVDVYKRQALGRRCARNPIQLRARDTRWPGRCSRAATCGPCSTGSCRRHAWSACSPSRAIAKTSRSFLDRNGKTPRGLSFYTLVLTFTEQAQGESSVNPELPILQPHQASAFAQPEQKFQSTVPRSSLSR